jgi:hypothetical protein
MVATIAFFGILLVASIAALRFTRIRLAREPRPTPLDETWSSIKDFYRDNPSRRGAEVDLGKHWTSTRDPHASFTLSWLPETGELVALRRRVTSLSFEPGVGPTGDRALDFGDEYPYAVGMKVLSVVDLSEIRELDLDHLHTAPDGVDQLTRLLGCPYEPPRARSGDP